VRPLARDPEFWRLVAYAVPIGIFAGLAALAFLAVVKLGTDLIWPEDLALGFFEGEWWWIAVTAGAGLLVGALRRSLGVPADPSGALASLQQATVDHRTAPQTVLVSAVSLIGGASLGPFDAGVRSGGAFGSWISERRGLPEPMRQVNTLSGMAAGVGGLLTSPFISTLLVSEITRPRSDRYYSIVIPNLVAAFFGFFVFFATVGPGFLRLFEVPGFDVEEWHFLAAILLGGVGALLALALGASLTAVRALSRPVAGRPVLLATLGGTGLGVIGVAFPLTLASGKEQLTGAIEMADSLGAAMLVGIVLAKVAAMALSLGTGFIGGPVMPSLFIGGSAGLAAHQIVPDLPLGLTFSCLLVAVAGATLKAPFSLVLLVVFTVGLGPIEAAPAGVAVITAYLLTSGLGLLGTPSRTAVAADDRPRISFLDDDSPAHGEGGPNGR
jgi:H+/Cl- antiporter ClcA